MKKSAKLAKRTIAKKITQIFTGEGIRVLPIKSYSTDSDIDMVVVSPMDHERAQVLLTSLRWQLRNNLSKFRERDKDLYKLPKGTYDLHLHRAISWNTVTYLDSELVWRRKRIQEGLTTPSREDEFLIIAAHSLFENKRIVPEEFRYATDLLTKNLDWRYMLKHAERYGWKKGLLLVRDKFAKAQPVLYPLELLNVTTSKFLREILSGRIFDALKEAFNYYFIDWVWCWRKTRKQFPGPILFSISGVDGSGKSTLASMLADQLGSAGVAVKVVHIGGGFPPSGPNQELRTRSYPAILILIKDFMQIVWQLTRFRLADVILYDRYCYDTLVKIAYKHNRSEIPSWQKRLCRLSPSPSAAFLLEAPSKTTFKRDQDFPLSYHREKSNLYTMLLRDFDFMPINAAQSQHKVLGEVLSHVRPFIEHRLVSPI